MKTSWKKKRDKWNIDLPPSNFQENQRSKFVCFLRPAKLGWKWLCSTDLKTLQPSLRQDENFFGGKETTHLTEYSPTSLLCGILNSWVGALSETLSKSTLSEFANCSCCNQDMYSKASRIPTRLTFEGVWSPGPALRSSARSRTEAVNGMRRILS